MWPPVRAGKFAYAAAKGAIFPGDPLIFSVKDGKLWLFVNAATKAAFDTDAGIAAAAKANWAKIAPKIRGPSLRQWPTADQRLIRSEDPAAAEPGPSIVRPGGSPASPLPCRSTVRRTRSRPPIENPDPPDGTEGVSARSA